MSTNEVLNFTQQEDFHPNVLNLYQDAAGNSYYLKRGRPQRLYAKSKTDNSEVPAHSPSEINYVERIDSSIFFETDDHKIYRARFDPP
ncbi:hypothetical protein PMAYCL1PPCAC_08279, partial [Pristionchus mayeri]